MHLRLPLLLVILAGAGPMAPGCDESSEPHDFPNQPGGNPLVPEVAILPYPSDLYLQEAPGETPSGYRVEIPQEALPEGVPASVVASDGFSMAPAILAQLPGGIDPDTLPDPRDPAATVSDDSPVLLVEVGTWRRIPVLAELDANTDDVEKQTLILRAHHKLAPEQRYVVILRDLLHTREGTPHQAGPAFEALRDGRGTADPAIEAQRESFEDVTRAISETGLEAGEVVLAWPFTTRSEEGVTALLVEMQRMAWEAAVGEYTIEEEGLDGESYILDGTFQAPSFLDADGVVVTDDDGRPVLQGTEEAELMVVVPVSVDEARPVIVYGHGFFSYYDEASYGAVNQLCRERRYSAVSTNLGFNYVDAGEQLMILTGELHLADRLISHHLQKITNFTSLVRLIQERLASEITLDLGAGPLNPLDATRIHYSGISNGGTFGAVIAATSPAFSRAALIVGGGGLTHFLQRAVNWRDYEFFFEGLWEDPLVMQLVLSLLQQTLDPIDSINYAHRLVRDRFPGLGPMQVQMHMALNDSQVRNVLTEWMARTADIPLVTPSAKNVWGLQTVSADPPEGATGVQGVLQVYDEHVTPSPVTNVPPEEDNGTHGSTPKQPSLQEHWYQFLELGRFVQVCDGPCDPD